MAAYPSPNQSVPPSAPIQFTPALERTISANSEVLNIEFEGVHVALHADQARLKAPPLLSSTLSSELHRRLPASATPYEVTKAGDAAVDHLLREMVESVKDDGVRTRFDRNLSQRELLEALRYVAPERFDYFVRTLYALSLDKTPGVKEFVDGKLDNVLHLVTPEERGALLKEIVLSQNGRHAGPFVARALSSSRSLDEMERVIDGAGEENLRRLRSSEVNEALALAALGSSMRAVVLPPPLPPRAPEAAAVDSLSELRKTLEGTLATINASPYSETGVASDFRHAIRYDLSLVDRSVDAGSTTNDLRDAFNSLQLKVAIELRHGVLLANEADLHAKGARWSSRELEQVARTLADQPEGLLLTTPQVQALVRVRSIDGNPNILGVRYPDGVIMIADSAIDNPGIEKFYPKAGSLEAVLTHELGHGLQMGNAYPNFKEENVHRLRLDPGDPRLDFEEFAELSGWTPLHRDRYSFGRDNVSVTVDGEEYPLETAVTFEGEVVKFHRFNTILFTVGADKAFMYNPYSRASPWEDWAETYAEYRLAPERLITFAPLKFKFFEEELGLYRNDGRIMERFHDASQKRGLPESLWG